jgi:hypothetical protein
MGEVYLATHPRLLRARARAQLVVVGVANDTITVNIWDPLLGGCSIIGSLTGSAIEKSTFSSAPRTTSQR